MHFILYVLVLNAILTIWQSFRSSNQDTIIHFFSLPVKDLWINNNKTCMHDFDH